MVGVELTYKEELEKRVSWQLDQATLKEIMIPSFNHTCSTLLDVELVMRLVKRFVGLDEGVRSSAALIKVAKLMDSYLAEVAMDSNLKLEEFIQLAGALPAHARAIDDGLYRAVDTYLKAHIKVTKQERKLLCRLIDCRKLSPEACLHASQNERLPVRAVVQVLFTEQNKISRQLDWSGPMSMARSPNSNRHDAPGRCQSKREVSVQHMEIKRLKEDVVRLQNQITTLQNQLEKVVEKKKGFFRWKKFILISGSTSVTDVGKRDFEEVGFGRHTPLTKGKNSHRWRKSLS
uniref:NPH3 domain-containing protein n=1 Tax=Chenopodium quinoa TaxID=63459 RepID=A0A803LN78_CHEQI